MNPQLSRKEEIEKGCGNKMYHNSFNNEDIKCGFVFPNDNNGIWLCPICQARLDERIRADQDFLKMIDEFLCPYDCNDMECRVLRKLKSTIQKETKK